MEIQIRTAQLDDLVEILNLVHELARFEKAEEPVTADLKVYKDCFREGIFDSIVAIHDGKIVGTCIYYMTFSTWKGKMLYLEDFVVLESQRGLGIGTLLFESLLVIAKQKECALVKWQVLDWNASAIRFYEKYDTLFDKEWWNAKIFLNK